MLRFFVGLTLAQLVIAVLVYFSTFANALEQLLLIGFVILLMSTVVTLWFNTVARHLADNRIASLKQQFASEREKINISAERAQKKLLKKTQKEIESERRKQSTRANLKIGGTIAVAAGFGIIMLMSQFFTLGLLSLTTAGGAIGGYLARSRRDQLEGPDYKMIEGVEVSESTDSNATPAQLPDQSITEQGDTESKDPQLSNPEKNAPEKNAPEKNAPEKNAKEQNKISDDTIVSVAPAPNPDTTSPDNTDSADTKNT